jgi:hypothetical protein
MPARKAAVSAITEVKFRKIVNFDYENLTSWWSRETRPEVFGWFRSESAGRKWKGRPEDRPLSAVHRQNPSGSLAAPAAIRAQTDQARTEQR